jgi:hypothetical protein
MSVVFLTIMTAKKTKPKKKAMTLEDFAVAIQTDYTALRKDMATGFGEIREEMATKEGIRQLRAEMGIGFRNVDADMKIMAEAMVSKADLANTLAEELAKSPYARQIQDLQTRVNALESKLGVKPTRRAA